MMTNLFHDPFYVLMTGLLLILAFGAYIAFFTDVEEDKPTKSKHKKATR